jgi:hypothetical protein
MSMSSSSSTNDSQNSDREPVMAASDTMQTLLEILRASAVEPHKTDNGSQHPARVHIVDNDDADFLHMPSVHINTKTWDVILQSSPFTTPPRVQA